jgi:ubiquinone/menaquinone biosynthesis C-methylase UbiE
MAADGVEEISNAQLANQEWWDQNPMTYDWQETLQLVPGSLSWFAEIDRRFFSSAYFAQTPGAPLFSRFMRPELVLDKSVLEVGCGMGAHAAMLARAGAKLTAIDLTETAVEMTRRRFEVFGLQGRIDRADAETLPFSDSSFDTVWSWGVIHHSSSMEACLAEMTRVLREGGHLLLMVYYRPSLVYYLHCGLIRGILLGQLLRRSLHEIYVQASDGFYARVFNRRELTALLEPSYKNISTRVVGLKAELFPMPRNRCKEKLEQLTPDWLAASILGRWGSMIVVEAVKRTLPQK